MNFNKQLRPSILFLFLLGQTSVQADMPKWYINGELKGFPKELYYIGAGEGDTYQSALDNASVYIASQLSISIESTIEMNQIESITNDESISSESFNQNTKSAVNQSLSGLEIIKNEKVKNKVYVFAVLDKSKYANNLKSELDNILTSIQSYISIARNAAEDGRVYSSIQNYTYAQDLIPAFLSKKAFFDAISKFPFNIFEEVSLVKIYQEIEHLILDIRIIIHSGYKQSAAAGMLLPEPVVAKVFMKDSKMPVSNMPIVLKYSNDEIAVTGRTDNKGFFSSYITAHTNDNNNLRLIAALRPAGLLHKFRKQLEDSSISLVYEISETKPITFTLNVKDQNSDRAEYIERKIERNIQKLGHSTSDNSNLKLNGHISLVDTKEIEGKTGVQYLATVEMSLSLESSNSTRAVSSFFSKGKGLSKLSVQDAIIRASKKIKISQKDLSRVIAKGENLIQAEQLEESKKYLDEGILLFDKGSIEESLRSLSKVNFGEEQIKLAIDTVDKIKAKIEEKENKSLIREKEERQIHLEKVLENIDSSKI